jgi:hypothetical protein
MQRPLPLVKAKVNDFILKIGRLLIMNSTVPVPTAYTPSGCTAGTEIKQTYSKGPANYSYLCI